MKPNKFGAKKTTVDSITFDSKAEASRYGDLVLLQKAGHISGLTLQVPFVLAPSVKFEGEKRAKPAMKFTADFVYSENGKIIVEDVKGCVTRDFTMRRHLMKSVHGIDIRITK